MWSQGFYGYPISTLSVSYQNSLNGSVKPDSKTTVVASGAELDSKTVSKSVSSYESLTELDENRRLQMASLGLRLWEDKRTDTSDVPIYLVLRHKNRRATLFTGHRVNPRFWNDRKE